MSDTSTLEAARAAGGPIEEI
ncbi:MAG: hypothetical protein QOH45_1037, partial [Pseudonocardiales bacterium]|nr:hypothetical protein [Pseudonocardiales bacterium]